MHRSAPSTRPAAPLTAHLAALVAVVLGSVLGGVPAARAQGTDAELAAYVRASYTKYEHRIPMRDGARLFTVVYVPKDASADKTYPILLRRTPYGVGPYGADAYPERDLRDLAPSVAALKDGFILAHSDVRGRFMSEGEFADVRPYRPDKGPREFDESSDAFDTIDWLVKNVPHNNGKVGAWGISYPGFYAAMAAIDAHPALLAASPQAPVCDWFVGDDFHHNGALFVPHAFNFYTAFGKPRPEPTTKWPERFDHGTWDGYRFFLEAGGLPGLERHVRDVAFWRELMAHETYDEFWQARDCRRYLDRARPALLTVGGWYDAEDLFGALAVYRTVEGRRAGASNRLVMGPWSHGGWAYTTGEALGDVTFGQKTSAFFQESIELPFFRHHLKGAGDPKLPEAYVFEVGRNEWHRMEVWPPQGARPVDLFLGPGGRLLGQKPAETGEAFDEYTSDPAKPVPYTSRIHIGMAPEYMTDDQRFAARRPDVLVWQGEPLESDLRVAGPIEVELFVSTTGTDADFVVKLIDVYPDDVPLQPGEADPNAWEPWRQTRSRMGGYQQLVRGEPFRGKFRSSFEAPEPFEPGRVARVAFTMPDVFHTFRRGHRVMVQVQSTWFPLVNLNPQVFMNIHTATAADFRRATHRVWRTADAASRVRLSVLP